MFPVGITKEGDWILFGGEDYAMLAAGTWQEHPEQPPGRPFLAGARGQGLLSFEGDCVVRERIDVVFPVLHGENGEDGSPCRACCRWRAFPMWGRTWPRAAACHG